MEKQPAVQEKAFDLAWLIKPWRPFKIMMEIERNHRKILEKELGVEEYKSQQWKSNGAVLVLFGLMAAYVLPFMFLLNKALTRLGIFPS